MDGHSVAGTAESTDVTQPLVECHAVDLNRTAGVASAGFNPALKRVPQMDVISVPLQRRPDFVPSWKPRRIPVKCMA